MKRKKHFNWQYFNELCLKGTSYVGAALAGAYGIEWMQNGFSGLRLLGGVIAGCLLMFCACIKPDGGEDEE